MNDENSSEQEQRSVGVFGAGEKQKKKNKEEKKGGKKSKRPKDDEDPIKTEDDKQSNDEKNELARGKRKEKEKRKDKGQTEKKNVSKERRQKKPKEKETSSNINEDDVRKVSEETSGEQVDETIKEGTISKKKKKKTEKKNSSSESPQHIGEMDQKEIPSPSHNDDTPLKAKKKVQKKTDASIDDKVSEKDHSKSNHKKKEGKKSHKNENDPADISPSHSPAAEKKKKDKKKKKDTSKADTDNKKISTLSEDNINVLIQLGHTLSSLQAAVTEESERLGHFEHHLNKTEDTTERVTKVCSSCQLVWRIPDFSVKVRDAVDGRKTTLYSPPFESHINGYKMAVSLVPCGDGKGMYDNLLSWPYRHPVTFTLMDQDEDPAHRQHVTSTFMPNPIMENNAFLGKPKTYRNPSLGLPRFVSHKDVQTRNYIKGDIVYIKIAVHVDQQVLL